MALGCNPSSPCEIRRLKSCLMHQFSYIIAPMYTITTRFSPMNDADLAHNFKKMRRTFYTTKGLWIPADITCTFGKIKRNKSDIGKPAPIASLDIEERRIILVPESAYFYLMAHINLLHEIAHLYVGTSTNWDQRYNGHGKIFEAEIDRLYALGAFRKLI